MANENLVRTVKAITALAKAGDRDGAYAGYRDLFSGAEFSTYTPVEQRQVLRFMILAKGLPAFPPPSIVEAHRAALGPLTELVSAFGEPADHELLGVCHIVLGNEESASAIFRAGLALERARNASSELCGQLMKRVASL